MSQRYLVMMLQEHSTGTTAWIDLEPGSQDEMNAQVGEFVMVALTEFRERCMDEQVDPNIELKPLALDKEAYDELEKMTWVNEMEGLLDDVERGPSE
jgi:hypothetical protein